MTNKIHFADANRYNESLVKVMPKPLTPIAEQELGVEAAFVSLLEVHCQQEGAVKPLPNTVFERIGSLKAKAKDARQRSEDNLANDN